jgi:hypothetical protein
VGVIGTIGMAGSAGPKLSAVPERKDSMSGSGRSMAFTILGVREMMTSLVRLSLFSFMKRRPRPGMSAKTGMGVLVTWSLC